MGRWDKNTWLMAIAMLLIGIGLVSTVVVSVVRSYDTCGALVCEAHVITEDDPRWNCHTMGNLVCGPR